MRPMTETVPYLNLHVPPDEMVKYIQDLMTLPHGEIAASSAMALARRHWGGDTPLARAALLRWGALNLAFQDKRLETWTVTRGRFSTSPRCSMPRWSFSRQRVRLKSP